MSFVTWTIIFSIALFVATLACLELGRGLRARRSPSADPKTGALDGAVFGLVGLLFGFTFYGAAERLLDRRELISEEANAISTAYLRVDLVQRERQGPMREAFRAYLDARLAAYANPGNREATMQALKNVAAAREELWVQVIDSLRAPEPANQIALTVPVNAMFDIGEERVHATQLHPPKAIYLLLTLVSLIAAVLAGFSLVGPRVLFHTVAYAAVMALTVFVIVELEYPRLGIFGLDEADKILFELKDSMSDYRSDR